MLAVGDFQRLDEYEQSEYLLKLASDFCLVDIGFIDVREKI